MMKLPWLPAAVASVALTLSLSVAAQDRGIWRATSTTARSITGDIVISDAKLSINFLAFTIAQIRRLQPAEASAAFDVDLNADGSGNLYRLIVPAGQRFLHHNTLCGNEDTQWMATYLQGKDLRVAFFSGSNMPVLTIDAMANSTNVCGTFSYTR
jgi:hypothetical protein